MKQVFPGGVVFVQPRKSVKRADGAWESMNDGPELEADIVVEVDVQQLVTHYGRISILNKSKKRQQAAGAIVVRATNVRPRKKD